MKLFRLACILSISIAAEQIASESPKPLPTLQLEPAVQSRPYMNAECAAKACVTCCWITAWIPTTITCLFNDLSCGIFCGKSPCNSTASYNDTLACADTCPPYSIPNTRNAAKMLLDCKPTIMQ